MKRLFILMALTVLGLFVSLGATTVNVGAFTGMDLSLPNSTHDQINSQREASRNDYPYAPAYTNAQVNDSGSGVFIYWPSPNPDIREVRSSFEEPNFPPRDGLLSTTMTACPILMSIPPGKEWELSMQAITISSPQMISTKLA